LVNATGLSFRPLAPFLGAEVRGVDLSRELSAAIADELRAAWHRYGVLLFRDQHLDEEQQLRVGRIFGEISDDGEYGVQNYVSNVIENGLTPHGELAFHCDHSWSEHPLRGLMLYGIEVPPPGAGGATVFADVKRAYELLPPEVKARIEGLQIVHTYPDQSKHVPIPGPDPRPGMPTATHPLAMPHPVTGETVLFCSARHFDRIAGWGPAEGLALVRELVTYIDRPEVQFAHEWRAGDLVVFDNFRAQHARTDFDRSHRRHLRRTQIGEPAAVPA
jgi:taurine dioxygenase